MTWRTIPAEDAKLEDHRRYPGAQVLITCAACGWSRAYSPDRVIDRLRQLKAGGHATALAAVARRVRRPCPGCGRVSWRADLAWPPGFGVRDARRLANLYRS